MSLLSSSTNQTLQTVFDLDSETALRIVYQGEGANSDMAPTLGRRVPGGKDIQVEMNPKQLKILATVLWIVAALSLLPLLNYARKGI